MPLKRRLTYFVALGLLLLASGSSPAAAQGAASGFELALHGSLTVLEGRTAHYRGVAYRVLGLAELKALPGARVRARYGTDVASDRTWREVRADRRGFFQIDVPMPRVHEGTPRLEVSVGDGKSQRLFRFGLRFKKAWLLDLVTDRQLYEPGESVHVWARLRDARSRRPLTGQRVVFTLTGPAAAKRSVVTAPGGVASTTVKIPAQAPESSCEVIARIGEREVRRSFRVGTRTYERLFAKVQITPETARPHQAIEVKVTVTTASGAPVRGAAVKVKVDEAEASATTNARALATLRLHAPAYMTHATGEIPVQVTISHPAHGSARAQATLKLAVPHTLEVEAVPPNGGLAPELDGVLHVHLSDGGGEPPPAGTKVEVRGAAIRRGSQRARTDRHGIVTVPTRLPRGAATTGDDGATTTVVVHVEGPAPRTVAIAVPVLRDAEVLPTVSKPVAAPGEPLQISLARRASAARVPVVVELLSGKELITARLVGPNTNRVTIDGAERPPWHHPRARPSAAPAARGGGHRRRGRADRASGRAVVPDPDRGSEALPGEVNGAAHAPHRPQSAAELGRGAGPRSRRPRGRVSVSSGVHRQGLRPRDPGSDDEGCRDAAADRASRPPLPGRTAARAPELLDKLGLPSTPSTASSAPPSAA